MTRCKRMQASVLLVGFVGALAGGCKNEPKAALPQADGTQDEPRSLAVPTVKAERFEIALPVRATGTTEPIRASDIAPQITARVNAVLVEEGQRVTGGAPLIRLDAQEARLRAAEAQARAASTEAQARQVASDFTRLAPLAERGTIPQQRVDQLASQREALEASAEAANAAAAQARQDTAQATVRAPFAGTVSRVFVEAGEMATKTPATKLLRLVDLSQIEVRIQIHERDLARISVGDRAEIAISSVGRTLDGQVTYVRPEIEPRTRSAEVVVRVPNEDGSLLAGMFAEVLIEPASKRSAIVVPRAAVGMAGDDRFVYVVEEGRARRRGVEIQSIDEARIEIVTGVQPGERVVTGSLDRVAEGVRIEAEAPSPAGQESAPEDRPANAAAAQGEKAQ